MGVGYLLYNAEADAGSMNQWDSDRTVPIDTADEVKRRLSMIFPCLQHWDKYDHSELTKTSDCQTTYSAIGVDNCLASNNYLEIYLTENVDGFIHCIYVNKANPQILIAIMEEFDLQRVTSDQTFENINLYEYDDDWQLLNAKNSNQK